MLVKTEEIEDIPKDIRTGKKIISIYGLGFVGTAITAVWLRAGATVIAADKNNKIVNSINYKKIANLYKKSINNGKKYKKKYKSINNLKKKNNFLF